MSSRRTAWCGLAAVSVGALVLSCATGCGSEEPESLDALVARVVDASPGRADEYTPPSRAHAREIAAGVVDLLTAGGADVSSHEAVAVAASGGSGESFRALVERGDPMRGDGLYVVRPPESSPAPLVVEAPHPVADLHSEHLAAALFEQTRARALLVAGAHRTAGDGAGDAAHRADSAFAAVDGALVDAATTVVQVHGFGSGNHDDIGEVVLSSSTPEPSPTVRHLARVLGDHGFTTCVYDGRACAALGATTNVEGAAARAVGADFVHIEVDERIRGDRGIRDAFVRILAEALESAA
ncbi:hypothetical protein [Rhodococcus rhodnii]|uniref:Lipoprotein n=1 Tax=Rhodococcus rhodnii LMG 5362 TaxID=1273125 RepID=R7WLH7_9NOCA|nr:hypothetical protein [Rhodococcus rhodnii]EOM76158.1 hypothetical protein Rrhod_2524 [Rhodococcus rhodnii LMG 5362]